MPWERVCIQFDLCVIFTHRKLVFPQIHSPPLLHFAPQFRHHNHDNHGRQHLSYRCHQL